MRQRTFTLALAVAAAAAGVAGVAGVAGAQTADRLPYFAGARALFERTCNVCHGLERPLSKTFDRAGWERTVERMHDNGAEASGAEREQIVAYLLTKNIFEARCSACHGIDRPLGASKSAGDWRATVERMSAKKPGHLSDAEVADIAAYLAVTRPLP